MPVTLDGLLWLLLLLGPSLVVQRWLHHETQAVFLLLTRRPALAYALFSLLFFPGILLHETSHWITARLLGVRVGRFSLVPRPLEGGRLQLGFVATAKTDPLRDALIGAAPLVAGGLFVAYAGLQRLMLARFWQLAQQGGASAVLEALPALYAAPDFWLWLYLTFAVSSTMLPSESDRRAWLPLGLTFLLLLALGLLFGAGPWLLANLAPLFNRALLALAAVFAVSLVVQALLLLPFAAFHRLLSRLTGLEVRS